MKVELLAKSKKRKIVNQLEEQYGISKLDYLFIKTGNEKLRIYSGTLSKEELNTLGKHINVELIGTKFGKIEGDRIRISFDAMNIKEIKNQITKNIVEIPDKELKEWMKGENIAIESGNEGFVTILNKGDILGAGFNRKTFIQNYVPKERRIKK